MGGGKSFFDTALNIGAGIATGGLYTGAKYLNDKRIEGNRAIRTAADQAKDQMLSLESERKQKEKDNKKNASNLALGRRLAAISNSNRIHNRGGTILPDQIVTPGSVSGGKTLLGF